ncbi:hypothetical protein LINPERPRIM_LOCUS1597 [Linum perenne]
MGCFHCTTSRSAGSSERPGSCG